MCSFLQFLKCLLFLKSDVMHLNIVVRLGNKVAKAGAYQNHGLKMTKKIVMMAQMKKVPYVPPILGQVLDLISPPKINISRFKSYDPWDMANLPEAVL